MNQAKLTALESIELIREQIIQLSDAIWDTAEICFHEEKSAQLQLDLLKKLGFEDLRTGLAEMPTAFSARWGSGKPVIGFLGEFDALCGLSQKSLSVKQEPITEGGNGHGCGHNLLGAGSIAAAYALKEYLKSTEKSGTVIYYGCPAEEGGSAKAFLARDGYFNELDLALTWHPDAYNGIWSDSSLANYLVRYRFKGVSAHAAAAPHVGRSALDAVELMNIGVQFLREHVPSSVRIHYAITDAGGMAPNVVQAKAEALYYVRANSLDVVQDVYERVNNIARGAALMTDTLLEIQFVKCCSNLLPNQTLFHVLEENLHAVPLPKYTGEELAFASAIEATIDNSSDDPFDSSYPRLSFEEAQGLRQQPKTPIARCIVPLYHNQQTSFGSTDVGDTSWVVPTAQINAACYTAHTALHSWQATSMGKSSIAHKGMIYAGKVLAGAAIDLLNSPETIAKAKAEHELVRGSKTFESRLPKDVKPPIQ